MSTIVRRAEFKRARKSRARRRQRNPIGRSFKKLYAEYADVLLMSAAHFARGRAGGEPDRRPLQWRGNPHYFDVTLQRDLHA